MDDDDDGWVNECYRILKWKLCLSVLIVSNVSIHMKLPRKYYSLRWCRKAEQTRHEKYPPLLFIVVIMMMIYDDEYSDDDNKDADSEVRIVMMVLMMA